MSESSDAAVQPPLPLFELVKSHGFRPFAIPVYLDDGGTFSLPPTAAALFALVLETNLLSTLDDAEFGPCYAVLEYRLRNCFIDASPLTEDHLASVLTFANLIAANQTPLNFDAKRVSQVLNFAQPLITSLARSLCVKRESALNRGIELFLEGKIGCVQLVDHFQKSYDELCKSVRAGLALKKFVFCQHMADFDTKASKRILEVPLTFSQSMAWGGLLTALEADLEVSLPYLREILKAVNMAPAIAQDPALVQDICPTLPVEWVALILTKFKTDQMVATPVDALAFKKHFRVSGEQAKLDFAEGVRGFEAIQGLHLENWKKAAFDADALAKMPFLAKYASV